MASKQEQKTPAGRIALLAALLAMEVSAAAAFGRVLIGRWPTVRLAFAAGVSVVLAGVLERRHVLLATLISGAAFIVLAALMVFPETTKFGLPTLSTLRAMRGAFGAVGRTADVQAAPALPLPPLMLAALTGVWTAAFSSHALAARARSPFLAVVPPAALFAFTNLVMSDGVRPVYVLPFLASVMALLFADGMWRIGQWGPMTMWHGRRSARLAATTTRGARRVALACMGIALLAPGVLPGFRSPGLVNVQGKAGSARVSINPIVDIRAQLIRNPDAVVFTVRTDPSSAGSYWRIAADDVFNGRQWLPSDPDVSHGVLVNGPAVLAGGSPPDVPITTVAQQFHFVQFFQPELPAAFQAVSLDPPGVRIRYDPRSGVLFDPNGTHPGYQYNVTSVEANPAPVQLDGVTSLAGPDLAYYTKLPSDTPREIYTIAHTIADSQPYVYRKILAIQEYLRGFRYSLDVRPGHSTSDILNFLKVTKAGYCEQFAGSMAVLLRALGIPARVAVGFTPGTYDQDAQVWRVTSRDAHAWVEVPFPDFGWLAFEPTPGRANPAAGYTTPPAPASTDIVTRGKVTPVCRLITHGGRFDEVCPPGATKNQQVVPTPSPVPNLGRGNRGRQTPKSASPVVARRSARSWAVIAVLALLGLIVLAIPALKLARRHLALARASDPRQRVLAAYVVLAGRAADVGWGRLPPETLFEYRTRLKARMSLDRDLDRVIELTGRAAYGESNISGEQADLATASARRVAQEIRKSAGLGKQLAGWFRLQR